VAVLAMKRTEKTVEDVGRESRGVKKPPRIRLQDIERPHRNENYLK
jgi:hypothetical protein